MTDLVEVDSPNVYEEEQVHGVSATWAQARKKVDAAKLSREHQGKRPQMGQITKKSRCWCVGQAEHFNKDCKVPRKQKPSFKGKGKGNYSISTGHLETAGEKAQQGLSRQSGAAGEGANEINKCYCENRMATTPELALLGPHDTRGQQESVRTP